MEKYHLVITLAVLVFMIASFLIRKYSYGLTAMTCVLLLVLTGVIDVKTAYSGFSHTTTILVATMMVVAGAIGKTNIVYHIREKMAVMQGKNGLILVVMISIFTLLLTQIMGQTAVMAIMLLIIQTLDDDGDICQSRMIILVPAIICAWFGRFPIGMGAALPLSTNAYYEGLVNGNSEYTALKNLGATSIGKVPPVPATCITRSTTLIAFPISPKETVSV